MNANQKMMAIAIRKSLLKETTQSNYSSGSSGNSSWSSIDAQRVVYMNDGDEFQIQLFNPENVQVGCLIYIDGKRMSNRKIVLRPGERIWLDRHIDTPDRLKFTTYEVGKSKQVQEAIRDNVLVKVEFYKERDNEPVKLTTTYVYKPYTLDNGIRYGSSVCDANTVADTVLGMAADHINLACTHQCDSAASVATAFSTLIAGDCEIKASACADHQPRHMETGRVEKGGHSDQSFQQASVDFEWFPFRTEEVKILPMSQKPVRPNDLQKRFCPYCGKKLKDTFKFCPYCGKEL